MRSCGVRIAAVIGCRFHRRSRASTGRRRANHGNRRCACGRRAVGPSARCRPSTRGGVHAGAAADIQIPRLGLAAVSQHHTGDALVRRPDLLGLPTPQTVPLTTRCLVGPAVPSATAMAPPVLAARAPSEETPSRECRCDRPARPIVVAEGRNRRRSVKHRRGRQQKQRHRPCLRKLPLHTGAQNQIWLEMVQLALDLDAHARPDRRRPPLGDQEAPAEAVLQSRPARPGPSKQTHPREQWTPATPDHQPAPTPKADPEKQAVLASTTEEDPHARSRLEAEDLGEAGEES